jgi:glycosyltransferase involved in cell wall biosynthesis
VVVPSYQQGRFLEETLRSILLQGYPDLELLVMDGGSTDETADVIQRYERWIGGWVSERDGGQSAAINKGWRQAKGELVTWLNSDDLLLPGWAGAMAEALMRDEKVDLAYCDVQMVDRDGRPLWIFEGRVPSIEQLVLQWKTPFAQQGFLMRRRVVETCGYLDEQLHFTMDTEYWLRLLMARQNLLHIRQTFATCRLHESAKTSTHHSVLVANLIDVTRNFCRTAPPEMSDLAERGRRRLHWNAAHAKYDGRMHAEARKYALQHLRDDGWQAFPRVCAMVGLSLLGDPGHGALALYRRFRSATKSA